MKNTLAKPSTAAPTIRGLLQGDQFKTAVAASLPRHLTPDRFIRTALTAMTRTPQLSECDQGSFFQALLTLSQLGLEPDGRNAHLIPFRNNKRGVTECQLIVDYKGLVELAMRSGQIAGIHADVVRDADHFDYGVENGELKLTHKINLRENRGDIYAVYAIARFKDGGSKIEVMTRHEVEAIRERSRAGRSGPWQTDWPEMAKKTVFRRLSKWLSLSPEYRDALANDGDQIEEQRFAAATPTFGQIESPSLFQLPATAPEIEEEPPAETDAPAADPSTETLDAPAADTPDTANLQDQLSEACTAHKISFDTFIKTAEAIGILDEGLELPDFHAVPGDVCRKVLKATGGFFNAAKVVAKGGVNV